MKLKLRSKNTYMILGVLVVVGIILGVLGGLGYFNKSGTPVPPGTDPKKVPGTVSINDVTTDGTNLTITFNSNTCDGCATKFTGTATDSSGLGLPIETVGSPGLSTATATLSTNNKIEYVSIQGYQFNESLKLEGPYTTFKKRIV
jgi:hypothetical protein